MDRIPAGVRRRICKALHLQSDADADVDELSSVLLQVVLAIMLIFMIAFFLFMGKVGGEIGKLDELNRQIAEAEKEKILQAVEKVERKYRQRYRLPEFLSIDPVTAAETYQVRNVIGKGKLLLASPRGKAFQQGSQAAAADYGNVLKLLDEWCREATAVAGAAAEKDPAFLRQSCEAAIQRLRRQILEVQMRGALAMQSWLAAHPAEVKDPAVRALIVQLNREPDAPDRNERLAELEKRLEKYVYGQLSGQCGAAMLEE